jgi:hypothetical protein
MGRSAPSLALKLGGRWTDNDTAAVYDSSAALVARSKTPVLRRVNRCRRGPPAELPIDSSTLKRVVVPNCGEGGAEGGASADAFVWDRLSGLVADPAKIRPINHVGRFFKVKGPLSVVPSPQGHPVLIQAGGSKRGIRAAAGFVDHVFGTGKGILLMAQQRRDMDAALRERGRPSREPSFAEINPALDGACANPCDASARCSGSSQLDPPSASSASECVAGPKQEILRQMLSETSRPRSARSYSTSR